MEFGRRIGWLRIHRPSGSLGGIGIRIGNRIFRRLFSGFVEWRLGGPRFLMFRHGVPLHPGFALHEQNGAQLLTSDLKGKRILLGNVVEYFVVIQTFARETASRSQAPRS